MNRRDFMRAACLAPLAAVPAVAEPEVDECEPCVIYQEWYEATREAGKAQWLEQRFEDLRSRCLGFIAQIKDQEHEIERLRQCEHPACWPLCPKCLERPKMIAAAWQEDIGRPPQFRDIVAICWRCPECSYEAVMRRDDG